MDGNLEIHDNGLRFRPDGPSSKIGELDRSGSTMGLTSRPAVQQHQASLLPAKREGAHRPYPRSPQSANHAGQKEDISKVTLSRAYGHKLII